MGFDNTGPVPFPVMRKQPGQPALDVCVAPTHSAARVYAEGFGHSMFGDALEFMLLVEDQHLDATTHRLGLNAPEFSAQSPDVFFDRESFGMGHRAVRFPHKDPKHRSQDQDPAQNDINIGRHLYSKGY